MTREEALKKVRQMSLPKETMEILQALAPELSESEDERVRKAIIAFLKNRLDDGNPPEYLNNWIAYLEKQKEQKPVPISCNHENGTQAEWSEEDEDFINMLILHFNYLIDKGGDSVETYKSYIKKLKSLRPSWKPSEEQIYSLGTVVKGYDECTVGSVGYHLKEMYEQLKKL